MSGAIKRLAFHDCNRCDGRIHCFTTFYEDGIFCFQCALERCSVLRTLLGCGLVSVHRTCPAMDHEDVSAGPRWGLGGQKG